MERRKFGILYALLAIILIVAIGSTSVSAMMFKKMDKMNDAIAEIGKEEVKETKEDDVVIAGDYTIRSTKQISDAYLSGDDSKLSQKDKETMKMADKVIKEVVKDNMSEYEKEEALYLWVVDNIKHGSGSLAPVSSDPQSKAEPHGVLKGKQAVCVGYATTFRLLLQMVDIECKVVHNKDEYHSWDMVKLDGDWYITDCYMDAESTHYANFNMNDEMAAREGMHDWDKEFFPAAVGSKYNYVFMNAVEIKDVMSIPKKLRKAFEKGGKPVFFNIGKDEDGSKTAILDTMYNNIYSYVSNYCDTTFTMYEAQDGNLILAIYINNYNGNQNGSSSLSEEKVQEILDALQKAFEGYEGEGLVNPPVDESENGTTDDGTTDDGTTDDGATDDGAADDGAVDDGGQN